MLPPLLCLCKNLGSPNHGILLKTFSVVYGVGLVLLEDKMQSLYSVANTRLVKQSYILTLSILFCSIVRIDAVFTPFLSLPKPQDIKIQGLREIRSVSSFAFCIENKKKYCYVVAEAYIDEKGFTSIILKKELNDAGAWKHIEPVAHTK